MAINKHKQCVSVEVEYILLWYIVHDNAHKSDKTCLRNKRRKQQHIKHHTPHGSCVNELRKLNRYRSDYLTMLTLFFWVIEHLTDIVLITVHVSWYQFTGASSVINVANIDEEGRKCCRRNRFMANIINIGIEICVGWIGLFCAVAIGVIDMIQVQ